MRYGRLGSLLFLLASLAVGPVGVAWALLPYTAPSGDLNQDGEVNTADLQCEVLVWRAIQLGASGQGSCLTDLDCSAGRYCRRALGADLLCMPTCLAPAVAAGTFNAPACDDPAADDPDCFGQTARRNADFNCDALVSNVDFSFLAAIILQQTGGPGTADFDGDGRLNFCDKDSDDDGVPDPLDCQVAGESPKLEICGLNPPTAPVIHIEPGIATVDQALQLVIDAPATDLDGGATARRVRWLVDGIEVPDLVGATVVPAARTGSRETWTVEVWATDGYNVGPKATDSVTIDNLPPTIQGVQIVPAEVSKTGLLTCEVSASDPDGDPVQIEYRWLVDGQLLMGTEGQAFTPSALDFGQTVRCRVSVTDGLSDPVVQDSGLATIVNKPPVVVGVSLSPASFGKAGTPTCSVGSVSDPEGSQVSVVVIWKVNGVDKGIGEVGVPWAQAPSFITRGDSVLCEIWADDGLEGGLTGPVSSATVIVADTPPSYNWGPLLSPKAGAFHSDPFVCTVGAFNDVDGDIPTVTVRWEGRKAGSLDPFILLASFVVGTPQQQAPAEVEGVPDDLGAAPGMEMRCSVQLDDGFGGTVQGSSDAAPVLNGAPVVATASLGPAGADATTSLVCAAGGMSDPDQDPVKARYEFYVNGVSLGAPSTTDTLQPGGYGGGDAVRCGARAFDGFELGPETLSAPVVIINTVPSAPKPYITPAAPRRWEDLSCKHAPIPATDVDGDPLTSRILWLRNGAPMPAYDGKAILAGTEASACDSWACEVELSDGIGKTEAYSEPVRIPGSQALKFSGSGSFARVPQSSLDEALLRMPGLTVSFWLRVDAPVFQPMAVLTKPGAFSDELRILIVPGGTLDVLFAPKGATPATLSGSTGLGVGNWHHVQLVADPSFGTVRLYLDANLEAQATVPGADAPEGKVYTFSEAADLLIGARCAGPCADGNPQMSFVGTLDELHLQRSAALSTGTPAEAAADASTVFLYGMNEAMADPAPALLVDRGPGERHAEVAGVTWVPADMSASCVPVTDRAPIPPLLLHSPCGGFIHPGDDVQCSPSPLSKARDPEGDPVSTVEAWLIGGVQDPAFDGATTVPAAAIPACTEVRCELRSTDKAAHTGTRARRFLPRTLGEGGASAPANPVRTTADARAALAPLIGASDRGMWSVSFWTRFDATPFKGAAILIGDDPKAGAGAQVTTSRLEILIEVHQTFAYNEGGVDHWRYRCGVRAKAFFKLPGFAEAVAFDLFGALVDTVPVVSVDPCADARWHYVLLQQVGPLSQQRLLHATWAPGEARPSALVEIAATTSSNLALVLPAMVAPGVRIEGFGLDTRLDELHIRSLVHDEWAAGCVPPGYEEVSSATRLLWSMEPFTPAPPQGPTLIDRGPFGLHGKLDSAPGAPPSAPSGIVDTCAP